MESRMRQTCRTQEAIMKTFERGKDQIVTKNNKNVRSIIGSQLSGSVRCWYIKIKMLKEKYIYSLKIAFYLLFIYPICLFIKSIEKL
jgi:hypothetical protein